MLLTHDVLCKLFNKSVEENKYPENLELGEVAPVHKGKSKMDHVNYKPISILPIFSKVIEKLMYKRLISFIRFSSHFNTDIKKENLLNRQSMF